MKKPADLVIQIPHNEGMESISTTSPTGKWQKSVISALSNENFTRAKWALLKSLPSITTGSFILDLWNQLQEIINENRISSQEVVFPLLKKLELNNFDTLESIHETLDLYDQLRDCFPNYKELESEYPDLTFGIFIDRLEALQVFQNTFFELKIAHDSFVFFLELKSNVAESDETRFRLYIQDDDFIDMMYRWISKTIGHVLPKMKKNLQEYGTLFEQMKVPMNLLNAPDIAQKIGYFAHGTLKAYLESLNIIEKSELSIEAYDDILHDHLIKLRFALDIRQIFIDTGIKSWVHEDIKSDYRCLLFEFVLGLIHLFRKRILASIDIQMFKLYMALDRIWSLVLRAFAIKEDKFKSCTLISQFW